MVARGSSAAFQCSTGHISSHLLSRCPVEKRGRDGAKFKSPQFCGLPVTHAPDWEYCYACHRGIPLAYGACSFCGVPTAPDVWVEPESGYSYAGNEPLLPIILESGLSGDESAEYWPESAELVRAA